MEEKFKIIKISKEALFEFIYEKFVEEQENYFDVKAIDFANNFCIDFERGNFLFCLYKFENEKEEFIEFPKDLDIKKIMKNIPDTTTSMFSSNRYKEYTKQELLDIQKQD